MDLKRLFSLSLAAVTAMAAVAVPAKRGVRTVTQPDGSTLQVVLVGDEFNHLYMTPDSLLLTPAGDGSFYFARMSGDGTMESLGIKAADGLQPAGAVHYRDCTVADIAKTRALARQNASTPSRAIPQNGLGLFSGNFPRKGKIKGLVILVEYSDTKFKLSDPKSYFTNMLTKDGFNEYNGTGSAHDFFIENSKGQFDPEFDVYGPYTLPYTMSYYGGNDSYGNDKNPEDMVVHACKGLNDEINFADFDMDNDGYVDNVFVFYAGQGEASYGSAESVWPHQWELASARKQFSLDGKIISRYACSNEWEMNSPDGVGTFIHEFSHVMGIPDLYQTDGNSNSVTPGEWSVMDYGPYNNKGRTPPNYSIYERNAMGWCEPRVLDNGDQVTLEHIADSNEGCIIQTPVTNEFFLFENRQKTGWDKYIPGHGLLVWHIDFNQSVFNSNAVNNTASHTRVRIIQANNSASPKSGWSFPGTANATSFTAETNPAFLTWNKTDLEKPVVNIKEVEGIITFNIPSLLKAPEAKTPTEEELYSDGFVASWNPVNGATDYLVTIYEASNGIHQEDYFDGKNLPTGWTSNTTGTYSTTGNYGAASPSLKMSANGAYIMSCSYPSTVNTVKFWCKGQNSSNSYVIIQGYENGEWVELHKFEPPTSSPALTDYSQYLTGHNVNQLRIMYEKTLGNVALDDLTVAAGGGVTKLTGLTDMSSKGATSMRVTIPDADVKKNYAFSVKATDGKNVSDESPLISVTLGTPAGIDTINGEDTEPEYYNLQGMRVNEPVKGTLYIVRRGARVTKEIL